MLGNGERNLAIFIDFENLALGFQSRRDRFEIGLVLKRLVEKGKIVAKKAYGDWNRFSSYTSGLHEAAIELVEIPRRSQTGKNSADIRLCVDAMDLAYSKEHINTFVVVSGDSDFSPLVSKLKELGKHVIGLECRNQPAISFATTAMNSSTTKTWGRHPSLRRRSISSCLRPRKKYSISCWNPFWHFEGKTRRLFIPPWSRIP